MDQPGSYVAFAGNDYLGLSTDERVVSAAVRAAQDYGLSVSSSRVALGTTDLHLLVEARLARFLGVEDAFVLASGWLGGIAYFGIHAGSDCEVFLDELAHSSLRLGVSAYGLKFTFYRHLDPVDLAGKMEESRAGVRVVATDAVFGITGAVAPLVELSRVAADFGAVLLIDDAHGLGVLGEKGRGTAEHLGLPLEDLVMVGSLSKALGSSGGFVAGRKEVIDLVRRTPPAVGSTPPLPSCCAAAIQAIDIVETEPERRRLLFENARRLRKGLHRLGLRTGGEPTPIIPIYFSSRSQAQAASRTLAEAGFQVPYFEYSPADDPSLLRAAARAVHSPAEIDRFLAVLADFLRQNPA